ncbi:MAG: hypothetical protein Q7J16_10265 [Candidatus Cloacimonadales bacterium]|nr:hypothetical protein [Candidatus Cloacimonadales bacterium]
MNQLPNLKIFVHPDELAGCNRLGITYENVDLKCFISYFMPIDLKDSEYSTKIENFAEEYAAVELDFPNENYRKTLYFKDGCYISPVSFHTRNWPVFESEHFRFIVANDSLFNDYSIQNLENFLQKTMDLLEFNEAEKNLLKREKSDVLPDRLYLHPFERTASCQFAVLFQPGRLMYAILSLSVHSQDKLGNEIVDKKSLRRA